MANLQQQLDRTFQMFELRKPACPKRRNPMSAKSIRVTRFLFTRTAAAAVLVLVLLVAVVWLRTPPAANGETPVTGPRQASGLNCAVPTARDLLGPAAVVPLAKQPPAKIII